MKNTLTDLNNYLFETLERLMDDDLDEEQMQRELNRAQAVTNVAETVIHSGELSLKAMRYASEFGAERASLPAMLENK